MSKPRKPGGKKRKARTPEGERRPQSWTGFAICYGERALSVVADGETVSHVRIEQFNRVRRVRIEVIA